MNQINVFKRTGHRSIFFKQKLWGIAFIIPTFAFFAVFTVVPLVMAFIMGFYQYNLVEFGDFVKFDYFIYAFKDSAYLRSLLNVFIYAAMSVPISVTTGILVANLVNQKLMGVKVFRLLYYIPSITGGVAVAIIWRWIFSENFGLFNEILGIFKIPKLKWISSPSYLTMFSVVIVSSWKGLGGNMLIFLAALKGISPDLYEAARVDGANGRQQFFHITLPSIRPTMYFILTMSIIGAFQLFDSVYLMVPDGLAMRYAQTPVVNIYNWAFRGEYRAGLGAAMSVILFFVIMVVTFATQRFVKEDTK